MFLVRVFPEIGPEVSRLATSCDKLMTIAVATPAFGSSSTRTALHLGSAQRSWYTGLMKPQSPKSAFLHFVLIALSGLYASGCANLAFASRDVGHGLLYASNTNNEQITDSASGAKRGEACASSILGLVTTGDASVASAAKRGGISKIATVENRFDQVLSLYASYCVIVTGE